jgi:N6-adenosine-specific RNA methylase IME4
VVSWTGLDPPYRTIVVDPPWPFREGFAAPPCDAAQAYREQHYENRTALPYSSMTVSDVAALDVASLADPNGARVFLWTTNHHLREAWGVIESWGFSPGKRVFVWCKPPRGTTWVTTEFILSGRIGRPAPMPWHGSTWFAWGHTNGHSVKPPAFGDLVESWCPGPYVELFARQPRLGWDAWGYGVEQQPLPLVFK